MLKKKDGFIFLSNNKIKLAFKLRRRFKLNLYLNEREFFFLFKRDIILIKKLSNTVLI